VGCLLGFLLGLISGFSGICSTLFSPVISVVRATPVACFIILACVFVGPENLPIFISALMVMPLLYTATSLGIRETSVELLEAAYAYRLTPFQTAKLCYLPSLRPHLQNALFNSIGLAWKAGLAAEIIVHTEESLGYEIWNAKDWEPISTALFAWTIAVILVSLALETLFRILFKRKEKRHVQP
jgi:NitT/TauT family transport system permease protein